jgi:NADP-dependent aldehyde dehydrogenase
MSDIRTVNQTNRTFHATDPATGEALPTHTDARPEELADAAREAALAATDDRFLDDRRRADFLERVAAGLRDSGAEIVALAGRETGLPAARLEGELERTARQLEAFAALVRVGDYVDAYIDPADPDAKPIPRPDVRRMLVPLGPVAVFGASNFPLAFSVAGGDTASALAAGCPVLCKGHPAHPGTGALVGGVLDRAAAESDLPAGVFHLLASGDSTVGKELVERQEVAAVAFTGSFPAGTALFRQAAARPVPIPVFAEMSSVNPLVVTSGALAVRGPELSAGLAGAIGGSAGQLCTKPGLIFLPAGTAGAELGQDVAEALAAQGEQVLLTAGIRDALLARVAILDEVAAVVTPVDDPPVGPAGFRVRPRLYRTDVASLVARPELREESFGPLALLVEYGSFDDVAEALEALGGQLTCTVHFEPAEEDDLHRLLATMQAIAGRVIFNGYPTGVSVTAAMHHGGPFPATTNPAHTSVGMTAIARFLRPIAWQDSPQDLLPPALRDGNPLGIARSVDGEGVPR